MVVAISTVELNIPECNSLKDKRRILKSLIHNIKNKFNVSVAEVANHEKWQRSTIGVSSVGNTKTFVNSEISKIINFIESNHNVIIVDYNLEIL